MSGDVYRYRWVSLLSWLLGPSPTLPYEPVSRASPERITARGAFTGRARRPLGLRAQAVHADAVNLTMPVVAA